MKGNRMRFDYVNIIDIESTCWSERDPSNTSEIIEVGIAQISVKSAVVTKSESFLVTPTFSKVSEFCTSLTTLTQELVDSKGYHFIDAIAQLEKKFDISKFPWLSWGDYDRKMFKVNCDLYGIADPFAKVPHFNLKTLFSLKYKLGHSCGMDEALKIAGLELDGTHHRGIDDALNIAKLYFKVLG